MGILSARGLLLRLLPVGLLLGVMAHAEEPEWNFSTSPIDWFNEANVRVDRSLSTHWSLGGALFYLNRTIKTVDMNELSAGLYVNYAFGQAMTDGWYIDLGAFYGDLHAQVMDSAGETYRLLLPAFSERLLGGYQWYFVHFNMAAAVGVEWNSVGGAPIQNASGAPVATLPIYASHGLTEISLGYAF